MNTFQSIRSGTSPLRSSIPSPDMCLVVNALTYQPIGSAAPIKVISEFILHPDFSYEFIYKNNIPINWGMIAGGGKRLGAALHYIAAIDE